MNKRLDRSGYAVLALLASPLLAGLVLALGVTIAKWPAYERILEDHQPVTGRLMGLVAAAPEIRNELVRVDEALGLVAAPASVDRDQLQAELQERARVAVTSSGMDLSGIRSHPPRTDGQFEWVSITLELSGSLSELVELFQNLRQGNPEIFIERLEIMPSIRIQLADRVKNQDVKVTVNLSHLKASR